MAKLNKVVCRSLPFLAASVLSGLLLEPKLIFAQSSITPPKTFYATQRGGNVFFSGRSMKTEEMNTAIKKARPGDTVFLLPGTYTEVLTISKKSAVDRAIRVLGMDGQTSFVCRSSAKDKGPTSIVQLNDAKGIHLSGLRFTGCDDAAIDIYDSSFIEIEQNQFESNKTPVKIRGNFTHHILIAENRWLGSKKEEPLVSVKEAAGAIEVRDNLLPPQSMELDPTYDETKIPEKYASSFAKPGVLQGINTQDNNLLISVRPAQPNLKLQATALLKKSDQTVEFGSCIAREKGELFACTIPKPSQEQLKTTNDIDSVILTSSPQNQLSFWGAKTGDIHLKIFSP